jgi:hypothetical protein
MSIEILGFLAGASLVGFGSLALLRHERWKVIGRAYGGGPARRSRGNALIWPSH